MYTSLFSFPVDNIPSSRLISIYETEQDVYHFVRNECNKKIEYATLKKAKATNEQIEYALYVNLPKMLRNTNIQPYSVLDCTKYAGVYQFLFDQLTQLFGMNIPELIVTGIECSFSYTLADKELLKPMLGRKRTTEHERDTIKEFNNLIKKHSLDAVENIVKISNRAMDENVRLKANVWIAEKLVGKNYSITDVGGNIQDSDINIFLNVKNATTNDSDDSESWNDDTSELDNWGEDDIYK